MGNDRNAVNLVERCVKKTQDLPFLFQRATRPGEVGRQTLNINLIEDITREKAQGGGGGGKE